MSNTAIIITFLVIGIGLMILAILYQNGIGPYASTGAGTSTTRSLIAGSKKVLPALKSWGMFIGGVLLFFWIVGGGIGGCARTNMTAFAPYGDGQDRSILFGRPPSRVPAQGDVRRNAPPSDREQVEATVFRVDVPVDTTGDIRSERFEIPVGYEVIPMHYDLADSDIVLRLYCYESETSSGERPWSPGDRCVGGWGSFSLAPAPTRQPFSVAWRPVWRGL